MVEFTNEPIATGICLAKTCSKCKQIKWRVQYLDRSAKRCIDCTDSLRRKAKCKNCGKPSGLISGKTPRKYCKRPECQGARWTNVTASVKRALRELYPTDRSKKCPACGESKPLTEAYFSASKRNSDGTVKHFYGYCKPCTAIDKKLRYASNPEYRAKREERRKAYKAREKQRRLIDPEFDAAMRAYKVAQNKIYRERRRQKLLGVGKQEMHQNSGPEMPAGPLITAIDAWIKREGLDEVTAAGILGVTDRRLREWRHPGHVTRLSVADKCLLALELNWFDVWQPEEYPDIARIWEGTA